jgi:single-stranded DNA-binding protein
MPAFVDVIGYVGKGGAEVLTARDGGKKYVKFSLGSRDGRTGDTTWYKVTAFNRDEKFAGYITQGKHVLVKGSLEAKTNENNGKTYLNLDVVLSHLEFLDKKTDSEGGSSGQAERKPAPRPRAPVDVGAPEYPVDDQPDDDAPF